jgi:hypothetical protein
MGSIKDINIDLEELEREKKKNFEERMKFIDFWTEYIKKHPDKEWSKQQKLLIDSQFS